MSCLLIKKSAFAFLIVGFFGSFATGQPTLNTSDEKLRIIVFGAHPDDAEYKAGGTAALWAKLGHQVKLVSVTNGDIGHWKIAGGPLAQRRAAHLALAVLGFAFAGARGPANGDFAP